jgi:hypothetical protein
VSKTERHRRSIAAACSTISSSLATRAWLAGEIEDVIVSAALVRHADDDEADARPGVEPLVDEVQFTRTVAHEHGGEHSPEAAAAGV